MRTITPLRNKVFIELNHSNDQLVKGGIILSDKAVAKPQEGIVRFIGKECTRCYPGQEVIVPTRNKGAIHTIDDVDMFVISESDLLGAAV